MYEKDPKYGSLGIGWSPPTGGEPEIIITDPGPEGIIPKSPGIGNIFGELGNMLKGVLPSSGRLTAQPGPKNGPPKVPVRTAGFVMSPLLLAGVGVLFYMTIRKKGRR